MADTGSAHVLVVEDDQAIGAGLQRVLVSQGWQVTWARTGAAALSSSRGVSAVLLDLGLPDMDGLDLCRRLRRAGPDTPIVMLTARGAESDVVLGLDAGADDYLVKPFRLAELLARLRAHTRRGSPVPVEQDGLLRAGDVVVDVPGRRVSVAGREVELRAKEFDLLVLLASRAGRVVTREAAMELVWDTAWAGSSSKTLDVHVAALRRRLGEPGPSGGRITTLRGVGYRLEDRPRPTAAQHGRAEMPGR